MLLIPGSVNADSTQNNDTTIAATQEMTEPRYITKFCTSRGIYGVTKY